MRVSCFLVFLLISFYVETQLSLLKQLSCRTLQFPSSGLKQREGERSEIP